MWLTCVTCNRGYDDANQWTICPHSPLFHPVDDLCPRCDTLRSVHGPCRHQLLLPVGTKVRFKRTITEPATGDHPEFLLCEAGTYGEITEQHPFDRQWQYSVLWERWKSASFRVSGLDIEVLDAK